MTQENTQEVDEAQKGISENKYNEMANADFKEDFCSLIRVRHPLFYITTNEENRLIDFLKNFSIAKGYTCYVWDSVRGLFNIKTDKKETSNLQLSGNHINILDHILGESASFEQHTQNVERERRKGVKGYIYVLLDYFRWLSKPNPDVERRLKLIAGKGSIVSTIITGPYYKVTDVLEDIVPVVDFPYANHSELKACLADVVEGAERYLPGITQETKKVEEDLINSVSGLTTMEAQTAFSKSLVQHHKWDIKTILKEKRQQIAKTNLLEFFDKTVPMDQIGGLKNLVDWIKQRKRCFSVEAEKYGLQKPRGLLTVGLPGCGKSLTCKAISSCWEMPLLRLDFGGLFNSLIGQSEANARMAIKKAEAIAPCILWIDEIEKAISGIRSSGRSDSGTTSRVLSIFLTWMQEKESPVFVVATANDHEVIPPEFLRAGRFDEIYFVDLPNYTERMEIFGVLLKKNKLDPKKFNLERLSNASNGYSGAEIEKAIEKAKLIGFWDNMRKINDDDILESIHGFKPLSVIRQGDFDELIEWSKKRCIRANADEGDGILNSQGKRDLDLE